ncbi:MAG: hypothetical protein HN403_03480 [Rhodospirillales bacterium]|jgi:hypothetical protein|nr:hypothetical protein [Rhodospirillales bacterium]
MEQGRKLGLIWEQPEERREPEAIALKLSPFPSEEAIAAWTADVSSPLFDDGETPKS